ncbi:hypothetical protein QL285_083437 [Trifolium repens]|jgi:hypothetical protein|nr:hypothetical protein QL285_083437 [Trifolium repens]
MPFTEQNPREIKLLAEEDKNSRKCQKESKIWICTKARSIVPRWEKLATKEERVYLFNFGSIFAPSWHNEIHRGHDGSEAR